MTFTNTNTYKVHIGDRNYSSWTFYNTKNFNIVELPINPLEHKLLTNDVSTSATLMFTTAGLTVTNAVIEFTKQRIVAAINNKVYEISTAATILPTEVYTHPDQDIVWTSITSSGAAIYLSAYSGIQSNIFSHELTEKIG